MQGFDPVRSGRLASEAVSLADISNIDENAAFPHLFGGLQM
jgi:hypothetical protein